IGRLRGGEADLRDAPDTARIVSYEVPVRLPEAEAATSQPVECGPGARHHFLDEGLRRKGDAAAGPDHIVEELGVLAAGLAPRKAEAAAAQALFSGPQKDIAGVAG